MEGKRAKMARQAVNEAVPWNRLFKNLNEVGYKVLCDFVLPAMSFEEALGYRGIGKDFGKQVDRALETISQQNMWRAVVFKSWTAAMEHCGKGTRFTSEQDIIDFLAVMRGNEGSPFPNGNVIMSPTNIGNGIGLFIASRRLFQRFGMNVSSISVELKGIDVPVADFIGFVFQLENLKSLTVKTNGFTGHSRLERLYRTSRLAVNCRRLTHVQIFEEVATESDNFGCKFFLHSIYPFFKSITHLRVPGFIGFDSEFRRSSMWLMNYGRYINSSLKLEELKIDNDLMAVTFFILLCPRSRGDSCLKKISLTLDGSKYPISLRLIHTFELIDLQASGTLEYLHLTVENENENEDEDEDEEAHQLRMHLRMKYRNLRHAAFAMSSRLLRSVEIGDLLFKKFSALRKVTLLPPEGEIARKSASEWENFVKSCWEENIVPQNVETICMPYFGWTFQKAENLPSVNFTWESKFS